MNRLANAVNRFPSAVSLAFFAICTISFACRQESTVTIKMIIPDGFRGELTLVLDRVHGVLPKETDEVYEYHIPRSGTLHVRSIEPFEVWHRIIFLNVSGEILSGSTTGYESRQQHPSIGVWGVGTVDDGREVTLVFFVGTSEEYEEYTLQQNN